MMRLIGLESLTAISLCLFCSACYRVPQELTPNITYTVQDRYLKQLPSPFPALTEQELQTAWGTEYLIGVSFAKSLDLYRAITAFRRAEILLKEQSPRALEIQYNILLCYYMGRRYEDVERTFNQTKLSSVNQTFPPFRDLLLILYDTYKHLQYPEQAEHILHLLQHSYKDTYEKLLLSSALQRADLSLLCQFSDTEPIHPLLCQYEQEKKSPTTAAFLNAVLPGSGYLYLGQRQTAFTAFVFNGLFIASSVYFFRHGPLAAGLITTSFEAGWYFGGIYGASYQAKFYNERVYEKIFSPYLQKEHLFPIFMIQYAF